VRVLISATDWGQIGAIAAIIAIGVTILVAIWQVRASRPKSRVSVAAHVDETWYLVVVVSNGKGSNAAKITSIEPKVSGHVVEAAGDFAPKAIPAGESETWSFELSPPDTAPAAPSRGLVTVRVDTADDYWTARAKLGPLIERKSAQ
jgi:hypothetical protein